jgi:hypothetical protein
MANVSVSANYMYRQDSDLDWRINAGITPGDYSEVRGRDPGPDGTLGTADDGGALLFYEIAADKRTLSPNLIATRPGFSVEYSGLELQAVRRLVNRWQLVGSLTLGVHKENYGSGSFQSPQPCYTTASATTVCGLVDELDDTRIDQSAPVIAKVMGSYQLPWKLTISGFYSHNSGTNFTRVVNSQSALGRPLNQGNVVVLTGTRNEDSYDGLNLLDLRLAYDLLFGRTTTTLQFDMFNLLNANTVLDQQNLSGSAFGRVISFVPPRIFRFGGRIRF